jgi:prolyl 4-hydroxylase
MAKPEMSVLKLVWAAGLIVSAWMLMRAEAELYTCLADMEELLETEALLMSTLDGYIQAQEEKLHVLRRLVTMSSF